MSRVLLQYILPLLLPTAIFVLWLWFTTGREDKREEFVARLQAGPWFWLVVSGIVLVAAVMIWAGLSQGSDPGKVYVPPRFEGGRILPGETR